MHGEYKVTFSHLEYTSFSRRAYLIETEYVQ
jgi:hypothetical protein